jgi:glycosyltransferase involved in cell wall biosynthesis
VPRPRAHHFDPEGYLQLYADVARSGMDPLHHYLRYGQAEGRLPGMLTAPLRARDLSLGVLVGGLATLEEMARSHSCPAERVSAAHAAADAHAQAGRWAQAHALLQPLPADTDIAGAFGQANPLLLAVEAALDQGDTARAQVLCAAARAALGRKPDLMLAQANLALAQPDGAAGWHKALRGLYLKKGLMAPYIDPNKGGFPLFDRLGARRLMLRGRLAGPLVSVIMPARNAAATIETALHSLSRQSWQRLEILVIDNGSTDATAAVVARLAQQDTRIRLIDGSAEPGAYGARNLGLAQATGAVITVLDADDWAHPARILRQLSALRRRPASLSHWVRARPDLRITRWWQGKGLIHPNISSLMIRREVVNRLGFWDRVRAGADSEYLDRLRAVYGPDAVALVYSDLPLSFGRSDTGSLTGGGRTAIATLHSGARRDYVQAAARWHARMADDLPVPRVPARRLFDVPAALGQGDPAAVPLPTEQLGREGLFDADWYLRSYADVRAAGTDPLSHYLAMGAAEGRDPQAGFSTTGYARHHDITPAQALLHWQAAEAAPDGAPLPVLEGALTGSAETRRILFFGHQCRAALFGAERSLLDMLDRSIEAGCLPSVVLPHMMNESYLDAVLARTHRVYIRPYAWLYGGVPTPEATVQVLREVIAQSGAVAVHVNTGVLEAPCLAARAQGVPVTLHLRELPQSDPQLCLGLGLRAEDLRAHLLTLGTRFVANSQAVADWLTAPEDQTLIVHNSVDQSLFDLPFGPASGPPRDPPVRLRVALIGSLTRRKGVADFATLARLADAAGVAADFVMIGDESADVQALGPLPGTLRHLGYMAEPAAAMAQADVVVSLSKIAESFGRTVLEAMAAGRPVICYARGTPPELVGHDGRAGAVVAADDPGAVLEALTALAAPGVLAQAGAAARLRARDIVQAAHAAARDVYAPH